MKILVSPRDVEEAKAALAGGADIIDVKNPSEGSLGAAIPSTIDEIKEAISGRAELSATLGDLPDLPGTAALAARGLATLGVDYVKAGLFGTRDEERASAVLGAVVCAVKDVSDAKIVAAGYADFSRVGSLPISSLPEVARRCEADLAMVDTGIKDGKRLFDFLSLDELQLFVDSSHDAGLLVALAGTLTFDDVSKIRELGPDVVGVRSAVCTNFDRNNGTVESELVRKLLAVAKG